MKCLSQYKSTVGLRQMFVATLLAIASLSRSHGEIIEIDFDSIPVPNAAFSSVPLPRNEHGLSIESNASNCLIVGTTNAAYTGVRAFTPSSFSNLNPVEMTLINNGNRFFSVRSVTLHPYVSGTSVTVPFVGRRSFTSAQAASRATGTALSGNVVTFPAFFDRLVSLTWTMSATGGTYQRFQISKISIEFEGVLKTSSFVTTESSGTAQVPFFLDSPRSTDTVVDYELLPSSATQPADYTLPGGSATGSVTIPAGQSVAYLSVPLVNDTAVENMETFTVRISTQTPNVYLPNGNGFMDAVVSIASDDGVTTFPGWMTAHGLSGVMADAAADPNGDGVSNIESWLFKINPAGPNASPLLNRKALLEGGVGDPKLTFFVPAPAPSDVRIIFAESTSLDTWSEQTRRTGFGLGSLWSGSGGGRVIDTITSAGRTISLRASVPNRSRPRIFLRNTYEYVPPSGQD